MAFIQPFYHSTILSFNHSIIQPFYHSTILSFNHSIIQPFYHSTILSFNHSIIQPFYHSTILSFNQSSKQAFYHSIKQRYHTFIAFTKTYLKIPYFLLSSLLFPLLLTLSLTRATTFFNHLIR
ncbi:hypothetical protein HPHPH6_1586 [Helicobacter pylori Hp H-6]|uniref:Uncharacterized protein n=1 Tax=Helicobacter pylori Hp H-6 TaxID=992061 RepID=J0MZV6_HELPX|nr:hypothetical protein HPHPH6_1586 [Helicobacter pylori Hp H-6]